MKKQEKSGIVLITGASGGIGKELYIRFEDIGYTAVSLSRSNPGQLEHYLPCDVANEQSVKLAVEAAVKKYGPIEMLINNAGVGISGATELLPCDEVQRVVDVDYLGALYTVKYALPHIVKGGKIVNISSACALFALPFRGVYCSAKAAMNMLSYSLRMELKDSGVSVVCVCPGDIKSDFTKNRKKYWQTNERYGDSVRAAGEKIDSREHKRMDIKKAGKKIFAIAKNKKGALYIVGAKYKAFYFFQRILPTGLFIAITKKIFY